MQSSYGSSNKNIQGLLKYFQETQLFLKEKKQHEIPTLPEQTKLQLAFKT